MGMFSFYTILPINIEQRHIDSMNRKFWMCPIVGLFFGAILTVIFVAIHEYVHNDVIAAVVAFSFILLFNRFLHMDGTIDLGDGLTVAGKQEDHVRALKDTRVGAGGVCMGIIVATLTICGYASLGAAMLYLGFLIEIYAKNCSVATAAFGNPSEGMAAESVRQTRNIDIVKASIISFAFSALIVHIIGELDFHGYEYNEVYTLINAVGLLLSIVWGSILAHLANKNFGFVNGDVLGAANETFKAVYVIIGVILLATVTFA